MQAAIIVLILGTIFILAAFLIVSEYLFKRKWGIPRGKVTMFSEERKLIYTGVEIGLLVLFILTVFIMLVIVYQANSVLLPLFNSFVMTLFFALLSVVRAVEGWKENRSERMYYHEIATVVMCLVMSAFLGLISIIYF
ncbi:DUF4181 domain-containing protein [Alkalihalophilus marmarensis]|uniref:DUF4181 domain-containing protein n=1 Tax=Alkalihalophilus marmarensis DSM 21297 TaxID=1188261 RepID=U6SPV8_9BACI|nr:DUF4181 domain-containing protein [Alkalihalophilus marmarensis]ERN53658.1 hypothetical protein A33I_10655 [Alkalihalophilus marmarensis DSM 21297]